MFICVCPGPFEGSRVQYASDTTMTIVFSCCQPSLVVSYDTAQGIHSVWVLRKVTPDVSDPTDTHANNHREFVCPLCPASHHHQERSSVLRCPVDPGGTPMGLRASGFLTSHLRNISRLDSPGGSGLAPGTGPRYVVCFLISQQIF